MDPLVSILIPCYNAEKWVGQAIESALAQVWPNKEVIVVDDGSTDGSLDVIKGFDGRIKWETGPNRGGNIARNRLLELSNGEWIQYLDADDYLRSEKVADQFHSPEGKNADVIFSRVIQESLIKGQISQDVALEPPNDDLWCLLVQWELPQIGAVLMRKAALEETGGWKVDQPCCQEHELYLRLLSAGKSFRYSPAYGAVYRQWPSNSVSRKNIFEVLQRRLDIIRQAQQFLRNKDQLTAERSGVINQAKLEIARMAWQYDPTFASDVAKEIHKSEPRFWPGASSSRISYSWSYRIVYRLLGFNRAEQVANLTRKNKRSSLGDYSC